VKLLALGPPEKYFLLAMSSVALPFAWLGLSLTVKRLRSVQYPLSYLLLFFVPFINLLMFLRLSILPPSKNVQVERSTDRTGVAFAILTSIAVCTAAVFLAGHYLDYGWALFVGTPFCMGFLSASLYAWKEPRTIGQCLNISVLTCLTAGGVLLAFAFEGIICILMAAPLALALAALGAMAAFYIQPHRLKPVSATAMLLLFAIFPSVAVRTESKMPKQAGEFLVTSSIEVNAPPEVVWRNVVTFAQLPEPHELLFKSGIAYPIRAEIHGTGVGAVRYCVFSTGPFVEPITVWDEPHLLEFSVSQIPSPMQELSPYPGLHPPHLDGFFASKKGHFVLTALPGGRTRLTGETWYSHNLWPETYWAVWSDEIIHRIHLRVLNHVKELSEKDANSSLD